MKSKVLGIIAIICAPFLYIDFATSLPNVTTWRTGLFGFIYMIGWICSIVAFQRMQILGKNKMGKNCCYRSTRAANISTGMERLGNDWTRL
jgi:hypothetical protein